MADDDHDHDEDDDQNFTGLPGMVFGALPPEIRKQMENAQAHAEMEMSASVHGHINLIDSLDEDALVYFRSVMGHVADHGDQSSDQAASWHAGFYAAVLWKRFGICPACGVNHDKEAHELAGDTPTCPKCGSDDPHLWRPRSDENPNTQCSDEFHNGYGAL